MTHDPREALEIVQRMIQGEAIEASIVSLDTMKSLGDVVKEAITASTPGEQQPVAWRWRAKGSNGSHTYSGTEPVPHPDYLTEPLYTSPPPAAGWNEGTAIKVCHALNEWADLACNAIQWLKNIRADVSTPEQALANVEAIYDRTIELSRSAEQALRREAPAPEGVAGKGNLPDYPSNLAREYASDALDDMNDEPREEDRAYTLAQWFHAALASRPDAGGGVRPVEMRPDGTYCEACGEDTGDLPGLPRYCCKHCDPKTAALSNPSDAGNAGAEAKNALYWAVGRWNAEVLNRPLQNKHRRSLDTTWRQVIRHFGGNDVDLCGPRHDELVEAQQPADGGDYQ